MNRILKYFFMLDVDVLFYNFVTLGVYHMGHHYSLGRVLKKLPCERLDLKY